MNAIASGELANFVTQASISALSNVAFMCLMLPIFVWLEGRASPAGPRTSDHAWFNVRHGVVMLLLTSALQQLLVGVPLFLTRTLGAGWIVFDDGVAGWCLAFVSVLLLTDLIEYLVHRAQHAFPFLWKLHELHHSAEQFDVTVTYRHFWVDVLLRAAFVYPLVGIVFKVPPSVAAAVAIVFHLANHIAHMNTRFPARLTLLVQTPQYHRLHHSRHERDANKNFSNVFPIWDILFGTLRRPVTDEIVEVGLDSAPRSVWQALLWPWCPRQASTTVAADAQGVTVGGGR